MTELRILNLGAGVQSTVLYLMDTFDYAVFADTQEEPDSVYEHLNWLQSLNRTPILVRTLGKLGDNLEYGLNGSGKGRFVSIPAFTAETEGGQEGILRRQCTKEYKVDIVERTIRQEILHLEPGMRVPKDVRVTQAYGITIDEAGRAHRIKTNWKHRWSKPVFPLLDKFMSRSDCKTWLTNWGVPHETPRSACVFCPYKSNFEWRRLRDEDPKGWERAVHIDHALRSGAVCQRNLNQHMYLHRSCLPLDEADINNDSWGAQYTLGFSTQCTGGCGL